MQIRRSPEAVESFEAIYLYIHEDGPAVARRTASTIYDGATALVKFPLRGRSGRVPGTRELILSPLPYLVIYRIREKTVEILRVVHGAQQWP